MTSQYPIYANDFKSDIHQEIEGNKVLSKGPGPLTDFPSARPLWGHEPVSADIPNAPYTESVKEEVVRLLKSGERVSQIAALVRVPASLVYRLRKQYIKANHLEKGTGLVKDQRCLYSKTIKRDVIRQLQLGTPVRQIAQTTGISTVTLHKWKKAFQSGVTVPPASETIDQLREQLREAQAERDALKKALMIFLRSVE